MASTIFDCATCGTTVNVDLSQPGLIQCPCCGIDLKTGKPVQVRPTKPTTMKCWACGMEVPVGGFLCPYCRRFKHLMAWVAPTLVVILGTIAAAWLAWWLTGP